MEDYIFPIKWSVFKKRFNEKFKNKTPKLILKGKKTTKSDIYKETQIMLICQKHGDFSIRAGEIFKFGVNGRKQLCSKCKRESNLSSNSKSSRKIKRKKVNGTSFVDEYREDEDIIALIDL